MTQVERNKKYTDGNVYRLAINLPKDWKNDLKNHCESHGITICELVKKLLADEVPEIKCKYYQSEDGRPKLLGKSDFDKLHGPDHVKYVNKMVREFGYTVEEVYEAGSK